jgi:hypothetical protein
LIKHQETSVQIWNKHQRTAAFFDILGWKPDALFLNWFNFQQMRLVDDDGSKASEGRGRAPATKFQKRSTSAYPATPNQANTNHPILSSTHILCCYLRRKWVIDLIMIFFFMVFPSFSGRPAGASSGP